MGLFDRIRGRGKEGRQSTESSPVTPQAQIVVTAEPPNEKVTPPQPREGESEDVETTTVVTGEPEDVKVEGGETQKIPLKEATPKSSKLREIAEKIASSNRKNWSPDWVGEKEFASYAAARIWAKNMRQRGYTAKLVKLKDGTYKVYIYSVAIRL